MTTEAPQAPETLDLDAFTTTAALPEEQTPEQPRRRRRRQAEPLAEAAESSSDGKPARRTYTRRKADPCKLIEAQEAALREKLAAMFLMTGGALAMTLAVTGTTLAMRAEQEAQALIDVAKVNPKFAALLLKMAEASGYSGVVLCVLALGTAAMVDLRAMPPTAPPAQFLIPDVLARFQIVTEEPVPPYSPNGTASSESPEYAGANAV